MIFTKRIVCSLIALSFTLVINGCSSDNSSSDTTPTFSGLYSNVFSQDCMDCHSPGGQAQVDGIPLDFSTKTLAYQTLTESSVSGSNAGDCGGVTIIGDSAETSYILGVHSESYRQNDFAGVVGCTPYAGHIEDSNISSLIDPYLNDLVSWINAGALNN